MIAHWKMQKWSKFQYQSRVLEQKIALIIFTIMLISLPPQVFGQEELNEFLADRNAVLIEQQKIILEVGRHSDIHVKHVIETGKWNSEANNSRVIEILPGQHANLSVGDEDGSKMPSSYDGETFEESKYIVLPQKLGNYDLVVEYDLDNFMDFKNNLWSKEIKFQHDVIIMIDDDIDLIFANSRPIDVTDAKGINCVGCFLNELAFFDRDEFETELISFDGKQIPIELLSNGDISQIEFISGGSEILNFNVDNSDQLIVLKIPFELLLNPFDVYFTEKDDTSLEQLDKIRKTEFNQDEKHVNVVFRTSNEGVVSITGATLEEHEIVLEQIKKRVQAEVESEIVEEKERGIALPIPGTSAYEEMEKSETDSTQKDTLSFVDDLEKSEIENSQNYTIILVIIGIIAAIIIGVIVKVKKN